MRTVLNERCIARNRQSAVFNRDRCAFAGFQAIPVHIQCGAFASRIEVDIDALNRFARYRIRTPQRDRVAFRKRIIYIQRNIAMILRSAVQIASLILGKGFKCASRAFAVCIIGVCFCFTFRGSAYRTHSGGMSLTIRRGLWSTQRLIAAISVFLTATDTFPCMRTIIVRCNAGNRRIGEASLDTPLKAARFALPTMLCFADFNIINILRIVLSMAAVLKDKRRPLYRGHPAPLCGQYLLGSKSGCVYLACAVQLDPFDQLPGVPGVDRHLAAVDVELRCRCTSSPDRRAIVQRIVDDQFSSIGAIVRCPVNAKTTAAVVYQSAVDRQRCASAENKTAHLRTIHSQIPINDHVALDDVILAAQSLIIFCE